MLGTTNTRRGRTASSPRRDAGGISERTRGGWLAAAVLAALIVGAAQAGGQDIPMTKLLPGDGEAGDNFGAGVAIDGTIGIIGASWDSDNGTSSGSAYLFDLSTGTQLAKLLPDDGEAGDHFGCGVALDGPIAIVGALFDEDNGENAGAAYLFDTAMGAQLRKLLPDDGITEALFGSAVAIDGPIAIIGAPGDVGHGWNTGAAYLFDTATGAQLAKLLPNDGRVDDRFGSSVAIDGSLAIIGAPSADDHGSSSGSAYVFDTTTGEQLTKLILDDGAELDLFGSSVAIDGSLALVGTPRDNGDGDHTGAAYLFDCQTGEQLAKLTPPDDVMWVQFGSSVALDGKLALVGCLNDIGNDGSGAAYLFECRTGTLLAKLVPDDGAYLDFFGDAVALDGLTAIIGSPFDDPFGIDSGSAYLAQLPPAPGDLNGDGCIDQSDLGLLLAAYELNDAGDIDGDGDTDQSDLGILLASYGDGC